MSDNDKWDASYMIPPGTTFTLPDDFVWDVTPMMHSAAWIRVIDKMPNQDMRVLVTDGKEFIFIGHYFKKTNHWGLDNTALINMDKVTHWMHLPDLPTNV